MTERVGRVEHVGPAPQQFGVARAGEEVPHQRLAGGNQLVGQHVPGSHLEPAVLDAGGAPRRSRSGRTRR